ncbi:MAG: hypothetical protein JNK89_07830, partial [Saprospiraceae bacterium]|nr:hypothetical protein [Saprospiraceae bacterium]
MRTFVFKNCWYLLPLLAVTACGPSGSDSASTKTMVFKKIPVQYPATRQDSAVADTYFGTAIQDPYRWLEDDQSEETKNWVKTQNQLTFGYLNQIPYRGKLKKRLTEIWNFEKFGTPFKKAGYYYYFKNDGLQNQSVLYRQTKLDGPA